MPNLYSRMESDWLNVIVFVVHQLDKIVLKVIPISFIVVV